MSEAASLSPAPDPVSRATLAQRLAADPGLSAFVSANAGSGKTKVLVDRVLRLLLEGAAPGRILCLTYTKAAAAHMAVKVFDRLASWVGLDDGALAAELQKLDGRRPTRARMDAARRLFARAVETPGGLKIETIHAFCERVLHLAPFEANVPARFEVLDEAASEEIYAQARRHVLTAAARGEDPELEAALAVVSLAAAGDAFDAALRAAMRHVKAFREETRAHGGHDAAMAALAAALGLQPGDTRESLTRSMLYDGFHPSEWPDLIAVLDRGSASDQKLAGNLRQALAAEDEAERLACYLGVFFRTDGAPRGDRGFPTAKIAPEVAQALRDERDRLAALDDRRKAARTLELTDALLTLAEAIGERVEIIKNARGALDFDDLIGKTRTLLLRSEAASWILHKLDAGIDHVLVDEAQDTNPAQWDILRAITGEFSAGEDPAQGGRLRRTIFAVGDPKQSIYGFQGAEPRAFAESEHHYRNALAAAGARFESVPLNVSFRSAPAILRAVDLVFGVPENFAGLSFDDDARAGTVHESSRIGHMGRVDVWEPEAADEEAEPLAWNAPVDTPDPASPAVALARRIAAEVARLTREGDEYGRRISPGEVLVLVRKRGALFDAIIRALKAEGLRVAGADRLTLGDHIAVQDLIAAGRAALLPEDDLTLAAFLKSPLVGLDDDDLMAIAAGRGERPLHAALAALAEGAAEAPGAQAARRGHDMLRALQDLAARHGAFGFYAALLGAMGGRRALVARLGAEAGDAIDEFLALALSHDRQATPSLAGFLNRFGDASHEVKRDMDAARGEIRVMTVHGAKGLEADLVILADACRFVFRPPPVLPMPVRLGGRVIGAPVWLPAAKARPQALVALAREAEEREREEHNRLLYVALTRARERLVIAPYLGRSQKEIPPRCWYGMIDAAFAAAGETRIDVDYATRRRMRVLAAGRPQPAEAPAETARPMAEAPEWLFRTVARETAPLAPLNPSRALPDAAPAAAAGARETGETAARREAARFAGALMHTLLEHLPAAPAAERARLARAYVARRIAALAPDDPAVPDEALRERLTGGALALAAAPELAPLFGPGAAAEVPVAGTVEIPGRGPRQVSGQIDRLAVTDEAVWLADFKLSALAPDAPAPPAHVTQLALYAALLRQMWPDRPVRPLLAFAEGPRIIALTQQELDAALAALGAGGGPGPGEP
ncbi:double-strand break repair helicase AddA [Camelimonas abortus]|uniref:DNA 3'-5' helicase n=1 Tax=Camelimonas abortus TaxID=1017184 RepID=A0ABV7LF50_9HYPH